MEHEWKIGDWCEDNGVRGFVFRVGSDEVNYVLHSGATDYFRQHKPATHLPDCTGWDWQPPKPIEPPEGYRLLGDDDVVQKSDMVFYMRKWALSNCSRGMQVEHAKTVWPESHYARKIDPQVRPMTRDEFLAAWKQRGFCPLIDEDGDIEAVLGVINDDEDVDQDIVGLNYNGWKSLKDLTSYKFASDSSPLTVEE